MAEREILTYRNAWEYRRVVASLESDGYRQVHIDIDSVKTKRLLSKSRKAFIDLTACLDCVQIHQVNLLAFESIVNSIKDDAVIIARNEYAEYGIEMLPQCFSSIRPFFSSEDSHELSGKLQRKPLYIYDRRDVYDNLVSKSENDDQFQLVSYSWFRKHADALSGWLVRSKQQTIMVDLTAYSFIEGDRLLISLENLASEAGINVSYLSSAEGAERLFERFPSIFDSTKGIGELFPDVGLSEDGERDDKQSVCSLSNSEVTSFLETFNDRLAGHYSFKRELGHIIQSFRISNRLHDQHILSLFLFGESGIGKTETARIMNDILAPGSRLSKINFESYSSQDSLNSLIGSPAGYIGCEGGELNEKLAAARSKVLLCDEFEKTTVAVKNFFLELLEDGSYTDRMGRTYDLDGYIIVFTSNIHNEEELKEKIPHELRTRFDLICEFVEPSIDEKEEFANKYLQTQVKHYEAELNLGPGSIEIPANLLSRTELQALSIREITKTVRKVVASKAATILGLSET